MLLQTFFFFFFFFCENVKKKKRKENVLIRFKVHVPVWLCCKLYIIAFKNEMRRLIPPSCLQAKEAGRWSSAVESPVVIKHHRTRQVQIFPAASEHRGRITSNLVSTALSQQDWRWSWTKAIQIYVKSSSHVFTDNVLCLRDRLCTWSQE